MLGNSLLVGIYIEDLDAVVARLRPAADACPLHATESLVEKVHALLLCDLGVAISQPHLQSACEQC